MANPLWQWRRAIEAAGTEDLKRLEAFLQGGVDLAAALGVERGGLLGCQLLAHMVGTELDGREPERIWWQIAREASQGGKA